MRKISIRIFTGWQVDVFLILVIGLISFRWFGGDYLLMAGDFTFPLSSNMFERFTYSWTQLSPGLGAAQGIEITNAYYLAVVSVLLEITRSAVLSQKIIYYIAFALSGLSMYYMCMVVLAKNRLASISAALFYMVNLVAVVYVWRPWGQGFVHYALFPAILASFVEWIKTGKYSKFLVAEAIIFVCIPAFISLTFFVTTVGFLIFISIYLLISREISMRICLRRALLFGGVWLLLNSGWLLVYLYQLPYHIQVSTSSAQELGMFQHLLDGSKHASLLNIFRNLDSNLIYPYNAVSSRVPVYLTPQYSNPAFILPGFLLPVLMWIGIIAFPSNFSNSRLSLVFLSLTVVIAAFFQKGAHPPFGELSLWLYQKFPVFLIFRTIGDKFGRILLIGYAPLIGMGVYIIVERLGKALKTKGVLLGITFFSLFLFVYYWPVWSGEILDAPQPDAPYIRYRVKIPAEYTQLAQWLDHNQEESFTLVTPQQSWRNVYLWGYFGVDPLTLLSMAPISLVIKQGNLNDIPMRAFQSIMEEKPCADRFLQFLNVGHVLVQNDSISHFVYQDLEPPSQVTKSLSMYSSISLERSFGDLDVYRTSKWNQHIYAARSLSILDEGQIESALCELGKSIHAFVFPSQERLDGIPGALSANESNQLNVRLEYKKINPTRYSVLVEADEPYWLVFSESHDPNWVALITEENDSTWKDNRVLISRLKDLDRNEQISHNVMVNGYANGWYVSRVGKYRITILYSPQLLIEIGTIISILSWTLIVGGYIIVLIKKRKQVDIGISIDG